jgi:hypothetical protein
MYKGYMYKKLDATDEFVLYRLISCLLKKEMRCMI